MKKSTLIVASLAAPAICCGCSSDGSKTAARGESAASVQKASATKPINKTCPIMNEHDVPASDAATVQYKGQTIGFCCADCIDAWEKMTDAAKDQYVRDSLAAR